MTEDDRERLTDTEHVLHGPDGSGAVRNVLYVVYVVALLTLSYGFTVARALVVTSDPVWVQDSLLSVPAAGVAILIAAALAVLVHAAGSRRGPVVPPLPWVDHVVASSIDRAAVLREWWVVSATLLLSSGAVGGGVIGGSLWAADATGPVSLFVGTLVGPAFGALIALTWLAGQVGGGRSRGTRRRWTRPSDGLRLLTLEGLRGQSTRSTHLGGAVLAGDLRTARLEVASPIRRGRHIHLRSRGPVPTVVSRDLLGLRRQPGQLLTGALLVLPGAAGTAWALSSTQVPVVLAMASVAACYLGAGAWAEGLRLLGDTIGTPRLSGLGIRVEALAHTVAPVLLFLVLALPVGLSVRARVDAPTAPPADLALWFLLVAGLVSAALWLAAFRGQPPAAMFSPQGGPISGLIWHSRPLLLTSVIGGLLTRVAADGGVLGAAGIWLAVVAALGWLWARRRLRVAADAHRV